MTCIAPSHTLWVIWIVVGGKTIKQAKMFHCYVYIVSPCLSGWCHRVTAAISAKARLLPPAGASSSLFHDAFDDLERTTNDARARVQPRAAPPPDHFPRFQPHFGAYVFSLCPCI